MTENFEEKLSRLTELLEKQIEAYADLNDTTKKTEEQQKKALESSILEAKGYKRVSGEIISIEEERIKAELADPSSYSDYELIDDFIDNN